MAETHFLMTRNSRRVTSAMGASVRGMTSWATIQQRPYRFEAQTRGVGQLLIGHAHPPSPCHHLEGSVSPPRRIGRHTVNVRQHLLTVGSSSRLCSIQPIGSALLWNRCRTSYLSGHEHNAGSAGGCL